MSKRNRLDQEKLEIYFLQILLAFRPLLMFAGLIVLLFGLATFSLNPIFGIITLLVAFIVLVIASSYQASLLAARLAAWIGIKTRRN